MGEALTLIAQEHVSDELRQRIRDAFVPSQLDLTLAINAVNAWNRFAIAFRKNTCLITHACIWEAP